MSAIVSLTFSVTTQAQLTITADTPQGVRERNDVNYNVDSDGPRYRAGTQYYSDGAIQDEWNLLIPFDLSEVGTNRITAATFNSLPENVSDSAAFNVDLYGVGYSDDPLTLPSTAGNLFFVGDLDAYQTLIQLDYLTDPVPVGMFVGSSAGANDALVDFLNNRSGDIVWLRLSHDASTSYTGPRGHDGHAVRFEPDSASPPFDPEEQAVLPFLELTVKKSKTSGKTADDNKGR